ARPRQSQADRGAVRRRSRLPAGAVRADQRQRPQSRARPVPALRQAVRAGARSAGGIWRYPLERLYEEVAYVAYHFHWPHGQILALDHGERQRWVAEIASINRRLNDQSER